MPDPSASIDRGTLALRIGFIAALAALLLLSLLPPSSLPPVQTGWDKADHALAWLALGLLGMLAWPQRKGAVLVGLVAYGGAVELLQGMTGWRQPEWADLLADVLGLVAAVLVFGAMTALARRTRRGA
jgi:VanZ family protein